MVIYEGKAVFEGVAIGKLSVYKKNEETVKREKVTDVEAEVARYAAARETGVFPVYERHPGSHSWPFWDAHIQDVLDWMKEGS